MWGARAGPQRWKSAAVAHARSPSRPRSWALITACLAGMAPALAPPAATAGQYEVKACNDAPSGDNHSWRQFTAGNAAGRFVLAPADDQPCGGRGVNGGLLARAVVA